MSGKPGLQVIVPVAASELDQVRDLIRAFVTWHRERHLDDIELINQYFDVTAFEEELASLPGKYGPPRGALLLATAEGHAVGCVALRKIDADSCEMKRMFVYPQFHGEGIGHALAAAAIQRARDLGYRTMLLDTSIRQKEAISLYQRLGFRVVEPYYDLPENLRNWLVFMELRL